MINANELMRDNIVIVGKGTDWEEVVRINEIFEDSVGLKNREFTTYVTAIEPIEITEEFLLKNGFEKELLIEGNERYDDWVEFTKFTNKHKISMRHCSNTIQRDWYCHIDNDYCCGVGGMDIEYVHQLQNVCTLAGFSLELII